MKRKKNPRDVLQAVRVWLALAMDRAVSLAIQSV